MAMVKKMSISIDMGVGHGNNEGLRDQINRMGPTVIFPSKRIAWGTVTPRTQPSPSLASYKSQVNLEERCIEYIVDVENYWTEEERKQYGLLEDNGAITTGDGDDATNTATAAKGGEQTHCVSSYTLNNQISILSRHLLDPFQIQHIICISLGTCTRRSFTPHVCLFFGPRLQVPID